MNHAGTEAAPISPLEAALAEAQAAAREQLSAAWQLQVERVEEQLHAGWREQLGRVFEERFAELAARLSEEFDRQVAERAAAIAAERIKAERRVAFAQMNQSIRRISQAQAAGEWTAAVLDAAAPYCRRSILFGVGLRSVIAEGLRGFGEEAAAGWLGREIQLGSAPAFAAAIESRDVVVAGRSAAEISPELAALGGESEEDRLHLYPILARGRCASLLYAEPLDGEGTHSAVEMIALNAGLSLGARAPAAASTGLAPLTPGAAAAAKIAEWSELSEAERETHIRAQRFARVQVAEMRLYKAPQVHAGRARQNLYEALRDPIDTAREMFQRAFVINCPSMVDYLHQELVTTLANKDASLMGPNYPGPLV